MSSGEETVHVPRARVALSTASVYPESTASAFEIAARLGYDGIEVMVSTDLVSQDVSALQRLSVYHELPIVAIHAPCLLITQRVWGTEPWGKLERSAEMAAQVGAEVVVVHPPFRWQKEYAAGFVDGIAALEFDGDIDRLVGRVLRIDGARIDVVRDLLRWVLQHLPLR